MAFQFPNPNTTPEFTAANGVVYAYDNTDGKWVVKSSPFQGDYVQTGGDTMTGELTMDDADILMDNGNVEFEAKGNTAFIQNVNNRFGKIVSRAPKDTEVDSTDFSSVFGVEINLSEGNTFKNNLVVANQQGNILKITSGTGPQVEFGTSGFIPNQTNTGLTSGIAIRHIPTPSFENSPGDLAVNKQYVDERDELLRQDIIELEEEIDAIAPSLEYGTWKFGIPANANRPPSTGTFYLLEGVTYTDEYEKATSIVIHNNEYVAPNDSDPVDNHTWADADVGELIQLFDAADPDFFLGKITAKNVDPLGECVYLTVDRIQSSGVPNDNTDPVTGEYLTRINIFKEPSGGNASEFVLKSGDTMTGELEIKTPDFGEAAITLHGKRDNTDNSVATVAFKNQLDTAQAYAGYLTYRTNGSSAGFFRFNRDLDLNNNALRQVGQIRMKPGGYIGSGENQRLTFHNATSGNDGDGLLVVPRPATPRRGFVIRGNTATNTEKDLLFSYTNSSGADAVNYVGKMASDTNLVNKGYVDSKLPQYIITESNGNYYIN